LGLELLRLFLRRHRRIAFDTSVFIYQSEEHPRYLALTTPVFIWLEHPDSKAVTSTITLTELLTQPYQWSDQKRVNAFNALLSTYPNLEWISPDLEIADLAARFRAFHRLKTPDALQAATAAHAKVTGFITNDAVFQRVESFETLVLESLL
jgi:predicted nucleic acid-binding protein